MEINILDQMVSLNAYNCDYDSLDPFAKSVLDQISLVEQRMYEVDTGVVSMDDEVPEFINKFVDIGRFRDGIDINDTFVPEVSFRQMIKLRRLVEDLIPCNYIPGDTLNLGLLLEHSKFY